MTSRFDFDLFVIGAGSGGVRAARTAAGLGARVAIAEERYFGGTCVNVGCIPKKLFVYAAHLREDFEAAGAYGWRVGAPGFDWATLVRNKDREIQRLNGVYQRLLREGGVEIFNGHARLAGPQAVVVGAQVISARHILLATGGWPAVPPVEGRELAVSSNEIFALPELPPRITVVGGGYIAVEFAGIFNGLGVDTTLLYRGPLFLRGFDDELRAHLAGEMHRRGVRLQFNSDIARIERAQGGLRAILKDGREHHTDLIMYATGRRPLTAGLGLEQAGVQCTTSGAILVDHRYRTSVPSIHAVGDVIDRVQLTPVALAEGMRVARALFGNPASPDIDYDLIPTAVFSQPNLATVGLSEADARDRHGEILVYKSTFTPLKATLSGSGEKTFMKMIVERAGERVIGLHMAGAEAGEIIQGLAVAMRAGATKAHFDATIGIHPTAAEEFVTMRTPSAGA